MTMYHAICKCVAAILMSGLISVQGNSESSISLSQAATATLHENSMILKLSLGTPRVGIIYALYTSPSKWVVVNYEGTYGVEFVGNQHVDEITRRPNVPRLSSNELSNMFLQPIGGLERAHVVKRNSGSIDAVIRASHQTPNAAWVHLSVKIARGRVETLSIKQRTERRVNGSESITNVVAGETITVRRIDHMGLRATTNLAKSVASVLPIPAKRPPATTPFIGHL